MICNPLLIKAKDLFKVDEMIHVPFNNWFDEYYDNVLNNIKSKINDGEQPIILTACGMSAKILIADLAKEYPNGIFLDIGSATDYLCTTCDTRGRKYTYIDLFTLFESILPKDWHDPKYNQIYENSMRYLRRM
jgi:hypothetical protein